jgi:hypothetical protein
MHSWDIIAYGYNGELFHVGCMTETEKNDSDVSWAVFADNDYEIRELVCGECHEWLVETR